MATYRFSLSAEGDLEGILAYSIDEWGIEQTARYRDQLLGCCQLIAQQTMLGRSCDDIRPGYLRIQEGATCCSSSATLRAFWSSASFTIAWTPCGISRTTTKTNRALRMAGPQMGVRAPPRADADS